MDVGGNTGKQPTTGALVAGAGSNDPMAGDVPGFTLASAAAGVGTMMID